MTPKIFKTIPLCSGYEDIKHQMPSDKFNYELKEPLEYKLKLGEYLPYATHHKSQEFMFKFSVYKYIYKKYNELQMILEGLKDYVITWNNCVTAHETIKGTYCHSKSFRTLIHGNFENISSAIIDLKSYTRKDFEEFEKDLEFAKIWNYLQRTIIETFYAYLTEYPKWLGIKAIDLERRNNCAQCKVFDAIGPPSLMFIALSAYFMPYEIQMPDNSIVPEGVLVNERAGKFHELHEHTHAYLHERKASGHRHPYCDWIEEGISDWTAIKILKPKNKDWSLFMEMYDFWIVFNSIEAEERKKIFKFWCYEPEKFRWQDFVKDMRERIQHHRNNNRTKLAWSSNEKIKIDLKINKYFI